MGEAGDLTEHRLHVPEVVQQIREDDDVEGAFDRGEFMGVADFERELRVARARRRDDRGRQVHAETARRLHSGKQVTGATSELQHPLPCRHVGPDRCRSRRRW